MARQSVVLAFALFLCLWTGAVAQTTRSPGQRPTACELNIRITSEDSRPYNLSVRVQLLNNTQTPIADTFTRDNGAAQFLGVGAGNYFVRVSSPDTEETTSSLTIYQGQTSHTEYVAVKTKVSAAEKSSSDGSVSATALNVPEKAMKELDKGLQALGENKDGEAAKYFSKAIEKYPRFAAAWNARGVLAMRADNPAEAQNMFKKAIEIDDHFSQAYINSAKLLMSQKKYVEAEAMLGKSLAVDPRDTNALTVLANLDLTSGKLDEAIANAKKVHELPHANQPVVHLIAAMALQKKQLFSAAAGEYRVFLQESPNSPSADRVRAQLAAIASLVH